MCFICRLQVACLGNMLYYVEASIKMFDQVIQTKIASGVYHNTIITEILCLWLKTLGELML